MLKLFSRILLALLGIVLALVLFLVGSIVVDAVLGADRLAAVSNTSIPGQAGEPDVLAYVAVPDGAGPYPAVIMIHEFYGLNESITGKADALAAEGYVVIAPDTFRGSTTQWIPRAIYQVVTTDAAQVNRDLDAIYAWMAGQPQIDMQRTVVAGFCYGGRASLNYALHNPQVAATVVFYGSPETDPEILQRLNGPVLGIFGGADTSIPVSEVYAFEDGLNRAAIPNEITIYPDQPHAFVGDIESIRAGGAQAEAWQQMLTFLARVLQPSAAAQPAQTPAAAVRLPFAWRYYLALAYEHSLGSAAHRH